MRTSSPSDAGLSRWTTRLELTVRKYRGSTGFQHARRRKGRVSSVEAGGGMRETGRWDRIASCKTHSTMSGRPASACRLVGEFFFWEVRETAEAASLVPVSSRRGEIGWQCASVPVVQEPAEALGDVCTYCMGLYRDKPEVERDEERNSSQPGTTTVWSSEGWRCILRGGGGWKF